MSRMNGKKTRTHTVHQVLSTTPPTAYRFTAAPQQQQEEVNATRLHQSVRSQDEINVISSAEQSRCLFACMHAKQVKTTGCLVVVVPYFYNKQCIII